MSGALYDEKITENKKINSRIIELILMIRNANNDALIDQTLVD